MPRTKRQKYVLINNQTSRRIRIYYRGTTSFKLRVVVLLFPNEDPGLTSLHHEATIKPQHFLSIPLKEDWTTFNGFVFDASRVKQICLKAEQATYPQSKEYVLKIKELAN